MMPPLPVGAVKGRFEYYMAFRSSARNVYADKVILAPMVRAGRLPMRLMAIKYGADLVYSEEHIDLKMLKCKRIENPLLGTVDFVSPDGKCQFRTCQLEKDKVVFQMGTANPVTAVETAKMVENDVAGIDVNMGCPKDYSTKGGMGAALLTNPFLVQAILEALVREVRIPVTCKIRLLPSRDHTLNLVNIIEKTGVSAVAVHGRYKTERPEEQCHDELIREVAQALSVPVIANGGSLKISSYKDIIAFKENTGCDSVMVARSALNNPSIFRKGDPLPIEEVVQEFVKTCFQVDETLAIVKYCLSAMLKSFARPESTNRIAHLSAAAGNKKELSEVHHLSDYYSSLLREREKVAANLPIHKQRELDVGMYCPSLTKRSKMEVAMGDDDVYELHIQYDKRDYPYGSVTPKRWIMEHAVKMNMPQPIFTIVRELMIEGKENRLFRSVLTLGDSKYRSTIWSLNKRNAEHSAALVALTHLGEL